MRRYAALPKWVRDALVALTLLILAALLIFSLRLFVILLKLALGAVLIVLAVRALQYITARR